MGPFPPSDGKEFMLVVVDYVSKWVEAIPIRTNSHREVLRFVMKYIFAPYGCLRAIISDKGSHFNNAYFHEFFKEKWFTPLCHYTTPPLGEWASRGKQQRGQEHIKENHLTRWEGLGAQAS